MCEQSITGQIENLHKDLLEARQTRRDLAEELTKVRAILSQLSVNVVSAAVAGPLVNYLEFRESDLESDIRDLDEDIAEIRDDFDELKQEFAAEEEQARRDFDEACGVLMQELDTTS